MDVVECIMSRQSIRSYSKKQISDDDINVIMRAAVAAPSGKNGQPWKFKIVTDCDLIKRLASLSVYCRWLKKVACMVVVFLDETSSYDYTKDIQSCGASIQNMLLASNELGIGSCWIGEILKKSEEVKTALLIDNESLKLMGIVAFGYSEEKENQNH